MNERNVGSLEICHNMRQLRNKSHDFGLAFRIERLMMQRVLQCITYLFLVPARILMT